MNVRWSQQANADMDRIWHFLADHDVNRADRVEIEIRTKVEMLSNFPLMGPPRPKLGIRELSLPTLQYRVGYTIEDDVIRIVAVRSTRENG